MSSNLGKKAEKIAKKIEKIQAYQQKHCQDDQIAISNITAFSTEISDSLNTLIMIDGQINEIEEMPFEDRVEICKDNIDELMDESREELKLDHAKNMDEAIVAIVDRFPEHKQRKARSILEDIKFDGLRIIKQLKDDKATLAGLVSITKPSFGY